MVKSIVNTSTRIYNQPTRLLNMPLRSESFRRDLRYTNQQQHSVPTTNRVFTTTNTESISNTNFVFPGPALESTSALDKGYKETFRPNGKAVVSSSSFS